MLLCHSASQCIHTKVTRRRLWRCVEHIELSILYVDNSETNNFPTPFRIKHNTAAVQRISMRPIKKARNGVLGE